MTSTKNNRPRRARTDVRRAHHLKQEKDRLQIKLARQRLKVAPVDTAPVKPAEPDEPYEALRWIITRRYIRKRLQIMGSVRMAGMGRFDCVNLRHLFCLPPPVIDEIGRLAAAGEGLAAGRVVQTIDLMRAHASSHEPDLQESFDYTEADHAEFDRMLRGEPGQAEEISALFPDNSDHLPFRLCHFPERGMTAEEFAIVKAGLPDLFER